MRPQRGQITCCCCFWTSHPRPVPQIAALLDHGSPEAVQVHRAEVCIDDRDGIGTSKLTPARLERLLAQPGTARNWNTIGKLVTACG